MPYKDINKRREYWRKRYHEKTKFNPQHKARRNLNSRTWYSNNKDRYKANYLWTHYKLEYEDYLIRIKLQNNSCAICKLEFTEEQTPYVDHCHTTGKVRGLLCNGCNSALGMAKENIDILETMIAYLKINNQS